MNRRHNADPQVAAMERERYNKLRHNRNKRPKIVAAILALRKGKKGKS